MPRIKPGILQIKGKLGDRVFVDSKTYGYHERAAPFGGSKKNEPALKAQYSRTSFLNTVAGELNRVIKIYAGGLHSGKFYTELQKRLRCEAANDIYLLLQQLKGLPVHPQYTLERFGPIPAINATVKNKKIIIQLQAIDHPYVTKPAADCYYFELIFLCRNKTGEAYIHSSQLSEWIFMQDGPAAFEFFFDAPAKPAQWLACLKIVLGKQEKELNNFKYEGMGIAEVGSFLKTDIMRVKPVLKKAEPKKEALAVVRVKKL